MGEQHTTGGPKVRRNRYQPLSVIPSLRSRALLTFFLSVLNHGFFDVESVDDVSPDRHIDRHDGLMACGAVSSWRLFLLVCIEVGGYGLLVKLAQKALWDERTERWTTICVKFQLDASFS